MARALDPAVEAAIREALADPTASYADVARVVGYDERQIRRYAIRWGLAHEPRNTLSDDQREKIRRMLRAGCWTYRQIAKGAGCSTTSVRDIAADLGLDRTDRMHIRLQRGDETP